MRERVRWATNGHRELARRLSKRLGISNKDATNILRIVGQEAGDMAVDGWVFSIPYFGIFWTFVTQIRKTSLPGFEGQMLGGNTRLNMTESSNLLKKFKEKKNEISANKTPE